MKFLIVLALIKCAATYSVIDPSNHKTVSVPIGNGMNVDIDVTVDVDTGANEQCLKKGWSCQGQPEKCCKGLKCMNVPPPFPNFYCTDQFATDDACTPSGQQCKTSSECCEYETQTMTCKESGAGKRCTPECNANEGEMCTSDDECCEKDNICAGYWTNSGENFYEKCKPKPEQCSANKGEECLSDHDCCEKDNVCIVIMKDKMSFCGLKDDGVNDHCTDAGEKCKTDSECCDDKIKMTCKSVAGINRCMPDWPKCNANEGEHCTQDEDCCEKDNTCYQVYTGEENKTCNKPKIYKPPFDCMTKGDHCTKDDDCCEGDAWGDVVCEQRDPSQKMKPICTYKRKDCIEDGEPCHGTDDWVHECCSESCCEGKCGTCGNTPWYKRS